MSRRRRSRAGPERVLPALWRSAENTLTRCSLRLVLEGFGAALRPPSRRRAWFHLADRRVSQSHDKIGASTARIEPFPNPACGVKRFKGSIAKARAAIDAYMRDCGHVVRGWTQLRGTATIRGVGFFDLRHPTKQHGGAGNDAQLHPVLGFKAAPC